MLGDDLLRSQLGGAWEGLWACGTNAGFAYVERSEDHGASKGKLVDGSNACRVTGETCSSETPGLWRAGDGTLYAAVVASDKVKLFRSQVAGTQFQHVQTLE